MNDLKIEEMKKFILITAVIGLFLSPAFAQINRPFKDDPALRKLSDFRNNEPFKLKDPNYFKSPAIGLMTPNYFSFPKYNGRNFPDMQIPLESRVPDQFVDGMPCFVPRGYFPMPVVKPDPGIKYSLLIKRY